MKEQHGAKCEDRSADELSNTAQRKYVKSLPPPPPLPLPPPPPEVLW
jgi:hypothetical protein